MNYNVSNDSKRIAKNTFLLYLRMLFLMVVSLYTSRVVLNALGVEDYGVYNVVGGIVTMFSVLSGALCAAISRFITFELGSGDMEKLKRVFSCSVTIQIGIALVIAVLAETVGLWFLNNKIVMDDNRLQAANWCYQFSILTFCMNLLYVPYNASIIAHEKMSAFAYITIIESLGKLLIAWLLLVWSFDRLISFSGLMMLLAIVVGIMYIYYCKIKFEECSYHFVYDHALLKQMFGFVGWNFIGASSYVLREQGGNIILNLFFGPSVNAARAIAVKVNSVVTGFVSNFMMALNPQITKSYANGEKKYMFSLIFQGARLSYYIILLIGLPVLFNTHYILVIWLKLVPEHTVLFVQLAIILTMSESISNPLVTAMLATGNIRNYQIVVGGLQMLNLPVGYFCLNFGAMPESVAIVAIVISQCCFAARLYMLKNLIGLNVFGFLREVYFNVLTVTMFSLFIPFLCKISLHENFENVLLMTILSVLSAFVTEYFIGCTKEERKYIKAKLIMLTNKLGNTL